MVLSILITLVKRLRRPQVSAWLGLNFIRVAACGLSWLLLCYRLSPQAVQVMAAHTARLPPPISLNFPATFLQVRAG